MDSQYYEAIIQLRNPDKAIEKFVEEQLSNRKGVFVSKVKKLKNGLDLYISSNSFAIATGRKMQERFAGILKISRKLYGKSKKTGKLVYRITVLFEYIGIKNGDIIKAGDEIIKVSDCRRKISGTNLKTRKTAIIDYRKEKPELLDVKEAVVTRTEPHLEVLHPETYQSTEVENPRKVRSKTVKVVTEEEKIFLVDE